MPDTYDTKPSWLPRGSARAAEREFEAVDRAMDFDPELDEEDDSAPYSATRVALAKVEYITVELSAKAAKSIRPEREDDGYIFTERDERHPGGEAVVVKGRRVRVARTERVRSAIGRGLLVETSEPETPVMSRDDLLHEVERTLANLPRTWLEEPSPAAATPQPAEAPAPHVAHRSLPGDFERTTRRNR